MTQPHASFLVFGTLYGSLIGHGLGMWIGTSQRRIDDQPFWAFWMMVLGMGIGFIVGVLADTRNKKEPRELNAPGTLSLNAPTVAAVDVPCVCYLLILPAFNVARE